MKRRIAFTLAAIMATTMLSACGGNTPSDTQSQTSDTDSGTSSVTSENTTSATDAEISLPETTTSATTTETTSAPAEPEEPKEISKITGEHYIYNNLLNFVHNDKICFYDIEDNKMYEATFGGPASTGYGKFAMYSGKAHNLETQEAYNCIGRLDEYFPVYEIKESFDENKYYFGVLNKNGEWELPLSDDYAICEYRMEYNCTKTTSSLCFFGNDYMVYDWKNDKVLMDTELGEKLSIIDISNDNILLGKYQYNGGESWYSNLTVYNTSTGEYTYPCDEELTVGIGINKEVFSVYNSDGYAAIFGENYEKLHEITGYNNVNTVYCATEDYAVFNAFGEDGCYYVIVLDNAGNRVLEPFTYNGNIVLLGDDLFLFDGYNGSKINLKTGEKTDYTNETYNIECCYAKTGTLIVNSEGAYYLVDISDPNTLINPFEIAE